jgi:hypothetical protein
MDVAAEICKDLCYDDVSNGRRRSSLNVIEGATGYYK